MLETVGKNLWTLVTIILPGLFTYGAWRLLLVLNPSEVVSYNDFLAVDQSSVITWSIIISIALLQQTIGLIIEFLLSALANYKKSSWENFYTLFCRRFDLANKGSISTYATSVIGNFFLSLNVFVGLSFLLCYFLLYEKLDILHWIPIFIMAFMTTCLISIVFRFQNSIKVVKDL